MGCAVAVVLVTHLLSALKLGAVYACLRDGAWDSGILKGLCPILHMAAHCAVCCRRKKKWNGPLQYEDESGELMMLPTDLVSPPGSGGTQFNESRQSCWHILV